MLKRKRNKFYLNRSRFDDSSCPIEFRFAIEYLTILKLCIYFYDNFNASKIINRYKKIIYFLIFHSDIYVCKLKLLILKFSLHLWNVQFTLYKRCFGMFLKIIFFSDIPSSGWLIRRLSTLKSVVVNRTIENQNRNEATVNCNTDHCYKKSWWWWCRWNVSFDFWSMLVRFSRWQKIDIFNQFKKLYFMKRLKDRNNHFCEWMYSFSLMDRWNLGTELPKIFIIKIHKFEYYLSVKSEYQHFKI